MKKLTRWATASAVAALLFSPFTFAETTITPVGGNTTVTVTPVSSSPSGFNVCYLPTPRHVEGSRIVQRCGPYGCQNFRVTRSFDVTVYQDCHLEKYSCPRGYKKFGWYPSKHDARNAISRCQNTISGNVPNEWRVNY